MPYRVLGHGACKPRELAGMLGAAWRKKVTGTGILVYVQSIGPAFRPKSEKGLSPFQAENTMVARRLGLPAGLGQSASVLRYRRWC
jgi:hypothetical protein